MPMSQTKYHLGHRLQPLILMNVYNHCLFVVITYSNYTSVLKLNTHTLLVLWLFQCRLRGKIDSNGCAAAYLEERLNMGLNFILSAEVRIPSLFMSNLCRRA